MSKYRRSMFVAGLTAAAVIFFGAFMTAQEDKPNAPAAEGGAAPGNQPGGPGPGGMRDPAARAERMTEFYKSQLGASEEEWTKIKPLVSDVVRLQTEQRMRGFGRLGRRGPGGPGGPGGQSGPAGGPPPPRFGPENPEAEALSAAVENESTPDSEIEAKLAAWREAQKKKEQELKDAKEKLRKELTVRQQAKLVLNGVLD